VDNESESRTALQVLDGHGSAFRRTARRVSLCAADADDALQRATLILLTKAPPRPVSRLVAWMHVVTRREALALRRDRERMLGGEVPHWLPSGAPCPAERAERVEAAVERARSLAHLKPDERQALLLRGVGYSYAEICDLTGWSYTKVNRCLAEGSATLRSLTRHES